MFLFSFLLNTSHKLLIRLTGINLLTGVKSEYKREEKKTTYNLVCNYPNEKEK